MITSSSCMGDTATPAAMRQLPGLTSMLCMPLPRWKLIGIAQLVGQRPEALPRVLERRVVAGEEIDDRATMPELGHSGQLCSRGLRRVRRQQREHDEPVGIGAIEVGGPVVVGP